MRLILLYLSLLVSFSAFASLASAESLEITSAFGNKALILTYTDDAGVVDSTYIQPIGHISFISASSEQASALKQINTKKPDTKVLQKGCTSFSTKTRTGDLFGFGTYEGAPIPGVDTGSILLYVTHINSWDQVMDTEYCFVGSSWSVTYIEEQANKKFDEWKNTVGYISLDKKSKQTKLKEYTTSTNKQKTKLFSEFLIQQHIKMLVQKETRKVKTTK